MPKPPTTAIEKALVQPAMEILQDDYCHAHGERPTAALLAQELYERRESSAVTRHTKHSRPLAHAAMVRTERLSLDAATVLGDWPTALSPRTSVFQLRGVLARALQRLGAAPEMIAMLTSRDVPELPDTIWESLANHPTTSWFVVHAVMLRRCQYAAPVHKAIAQAWRTGVALVQNCIARPCLRVAAHAVWESALQFIPSHADALRFTEIDETARSQARPSSMSLAERSFLYHALIKFVPAAVAGENPTWWQKLPPDVAEFLQRAAFFRDLERMSKLVADDVDMAEEGLALLCKQHAVFRGKRFLMEKSSAIIPAYVPDGLPKTFH